MKFEAKNNIYIVTIIMVFMINGILTSAQEYPVVDQTGLSQSAQLEKAYKFSGFVYQGKMGTEGSPIAGMKVMLYCSYDPSSQGRLAASTTTNLEGQYELTIYPVCRFYNIRLADSDGFHTVGAASVEGNAINNSSIQYAYPLKKELLIGDKFWMNYSVPSPQESPCSEDCECMYRDYVEAMGTYSKWQSCSSRICGGNELRPKYCYKSLPGCPEGCECMDQETADDTWESWQRCNTSICGYNREKPMYCFRAEGTL